MANNMTPAAILYAGPVAHIRHVPPLRRFTYRVWMLSLDLDRIKDAENTSKLFSHNRFNLTALYDRDHGFRDGRSLRNYAEAALSRDGLSDYAAKITFMSMPRLLGYAFNPISFYFCYNVKGELGAVLHQVKNTFGDQTGYLMPVPPEPGPIRQTTKKRMHVSPFFDMQGGYNFAFTPPGENFNLAIEYGAEIKRLTATMQLKASEFSSQTLLKLILEIPFVTIKVIAAIHWQAVKLLFRGAKFHKAPVYKEVSTSFSEEKEAKRLF
jgi:DUF1365 family protein